MSSYSSMDKLLKVLYKNTDSEWALRHIKELTDIERGQTFRNYKQSANYVYNLLKAESFSPETLTFPADGETVYQDKRMPLAWEASVGKLTVVSSPVPFADPVLADFEKEPFNLVKHSVSTPDSGIVVPVVAESMVYAGEDCRGAMVLLEAENRPETSVISPLLDLGAIGYISDFLTGASDTPDNVQWVSGAADDSMHWHVQSEDRDFIAFSISPRNGRALRSAVLAGGVKVKVLCDGKRKKGEINAVTALIPGKRDEEIWVLAHLYEPLASDNSAGVISAISAVKLIKDMIDKGKLPPLEFSIRLVFAMELYGFAAVAEHFGGNLQKRAVGGINMDALVADNADNHYKAFITPYASPFFGNYIFKLAAESYQKEIDSESFKKWMPSYSDDLALGDSAVGLPTVWPLHDNETGLSFWHNSVRGNSFLDEEKIKKTITLFALWIGKTATLTKEEMPEILKIAAEYAQKKVDSEAEFDNTNKRVETFFEGEKKHLRDFKKVWDISEIEEAANSLKMPETEEREINSTWLDYAEKIVVKRAGRGFPFDLVKLPKEKRKRLPDSMLYGPMTAIVSYIDGETNLKDIILKAMWEYRAAVSDRAVRSYINAVMYLADGGYLETVKAEVVTKDDIVNTLYKLGINKGDVLLVHGGQSGCGYVAGGEDTVIDAFYEAVGKDGGVLMPSFTRPYAAFEGTLNRGRNFRPFEKGNTDNIWTGNLPKAMARREDSARSAHATHSWCGLGAKAASCVAEQALLDPPASETSPMAKAHSMGGKVVFFGCNTSSNTFIHYLEHMAGSEFLENAIVKIKEEDGKIHTEVIHNHVPGCRDFYNPKDLNSKFYIRAIAKGLAVKEEKLGAGRVCAMDLKQLYEIGMELFKEDKNVTLCDNPECVFCKKFR